MKFLRFALVFLLAGTPSFLPAEHTKTEPPQLTVVIVIDQFAYSHIKKLAPHFKFGIKYLLKNGINFINAHYPHGATCTATGHAALGTGTFAKDHGIVLNDWLDEHGRTQGFKDKNPDAAQFYGLNQTQLCNYGFSAKNLMTDGVSDQLILSSTPEIKNRVYSLSYKPRAAIGMGGHLGKSVWFNHHTLTFTSSKAFFKKLPEWVVNFNKENDLSKITKAFWKTAYPLSSPAYDFENINDYEYCTPKTPRANSAVTITHKRQDFTHIPRKKAKSTFVKLPQANKLLLDLATKCLDAKFKPHVEKNGNFLLWVSLSTLDMIGHAYGPNCLETIDMIYHLDKQLMDFIQQVEKMIDKRKVLFVLTADHGVFPTPEHVNKKGDETAHRILQKNLIRDLNQTIFKQFGLDNIIAQIKVNQLYLNKKLFSSLAPETKQEILESLKQTIKKNPGIRHVWTSDELSNSSFDPEQIENYYKNQHYPGRSGDLICMTEPGSFIAKHTHGTSHCSPYENTTHVPLIMYQPKKIEAKTIGSRVWIPQVPVTIAKILRIQPPSTSPFQELPGILSQEK